jgi:hypothetical protein
MPPEPRPGRVTVSLFAGLQAGGPASMVRQMDRKRFQFAVGVPVFGILAALEGLLIFAPAMGASFVYWSEACEVGLGLLGAYAWYIVPASRPNSNGS